MFKRKVGAAVAIPTRICHPFEQCRDSHQAEQNLSYYSNNMEEYLYKEKPTVP